MKKFIYLLIIITTPILLSGCSISKDELTSEISQIKNQEKQLFVQKVIFSNNLKYRLQDSRALIYSVESGSEKLADYLISKGADINFTDRSGNSPLVYAALADNLSMVKFLISRDASPEIGADKPLIIAVKNENIKMINFLLSKRANINIQDENLNTPLLTAVKKRNLQILTALLAKGATAEMANLDGETPLSLAILNNDSAMVNRLQKGSGNYNPISSFLHAARSNNLKGLKYLLATGIDINCQNDRGETALIMACKNARNSRTIRFLIDKGAKVNFKDNNGTTPLMTAVKNLKSLRVLQFLVKKGANLRSRDKKGNSLLHYSVKYNGKKQWLRLRALKFLVKKGAHVNIKNYDKKSPFDYISRSNNYQLLEFFISRKAYIHKRDKMGENLLFYHCRNGNFRIIKLLVNRGINLNGRNSENGETPLFAAVKRGNRSIIRYLVKKGASINARNQLGRSVLFDLYDIRLCRLLVDLKVDVNIRDKNRESALFLAIKYGDTRTVRFLVKAGASTSFKNSSGVTPLKLSKNKGFSDIEYILIKNS